MVNARRKICFVLPSLAGGGCERAAVQILNGLDEAMWDRSMYLFRREGPYLRDVSSSVALHAGADGADDSRAGRWRALRRFVRDTRPDIVVGFLSYFTVLTAVRAAAVGTRVVFDLQTPMTAFLQDRDYPWRRGWRRRAFATVARAGYGSADLVIATSQGVADDLVAAFGVSRDALRVVHNPVDLDAVAAAAQEPIDAAHAEAWRRPVIVAAGRLAEAKNYPLLIEALAILRQRVPARLFILGRGDEERAIRELAAARGVDAAVVLCGFQQNPWKYIARADVFALTSRYEGFGNVLVEAMACGVPVVATRSPGTSDIVRDGIDGLLVDRHEPAAFAGALERLLADEPYRRRLADEARIAAGRFASPVIAREYERVFRELAA
jgi:glycosyltransferase involved in cell wall biosynthesis